MYSPVDTRIPSEVEEQVHAIYCQIYPKAGRGFVPRAFGWAERCFGGGYDDYQAIDARYHDFEHTLQGTLCLARLLHNRHQANGQPPLNQRMFELGLLAILFHDTGYLKKKSDESGTGAKYTLTHVDRSANFARQFLGQEGVAEGELLAVQNMIRCTGVNADLADIPFQTELERVVGFALATADLLGQMAAVDYVAKLPVLYLEFAEAVEFTRDTNTRLARYKSAEDLMRNTPEFFTSYVLPRIQDEFQGLYRYLNVPYPDGPNSYLKQIERNLKQLKESYPEAK